MHEYFLLLLRVMIVNRKLNLGIIELASFGDAVRLTNEVCF